MTEPRSAEDVLRNCPHGPGSIELYVCRPCIQHFARAYAAQKCAALESQIASTADLLNICLRESGLAAAQVEVGNLKPGVEALYFKCIALQQRMEALKRDADAIWDLIKEATRTFNSRGEASAVLQILHRQREAALRGSEKQDL